MRLLTEAQMLEAPVANVLLEVDRGFLALTACDILLESFNAAAIRMISQDLELFESNAIFIPHSEFLCYR